MRLIDADKLMSALEAEDVKSKTQILKIIGEQEEIPDIFNMNPYDAAKELLMKCSNELALREMVDHMLVTFKYAEKV